MVVVPLSAFRLWRAAPDMCGIAGIFHMDGATPDDGNALEAMQRSLVHRGPDGHGSFVRGSVRLTMRRLSIIDVEGGVQPINNETDTVHVVLNGEIYNYIELKKTLIDAGLKFSTTSDTEVLLNSYIYWKEELLNKVKGMFAFAIYDKKKRQIFCSRDHFGQKPFFYYFKNGNFIFSSELTSLISNPVIKKELCSMDLATLI